MKLMIPSQDDRADAQIAEAFGRAPWFAVFDTKSRALNFIQNDGAGNQGGAGIAAAQTAVDNGAGALAVFRLGQNAAEVLAAAEVKVYEAVKGSIDENVKLFMDGKLPLLTETHPGRHGGPNQ